MRVNSSGVPQAPNQRRILPSLQGAVRRPTTQAVAGVWALLSDSPFRDNGRWRSAAVALLDNDSQISVLVEGLDHPESIAWGQDGYAYAGGEAGQLYRIDIEHGEASRFADTGGFILGIALDAEHNVYACDTGNHAVVKVAPDGAVSTYSAGYGGQPFKTPNYAAFDAAGNLYMCDSGSWKADDGAIYRLRPGGATELWFDGLREFPNGLCLGPDGSDLYVAMSLSPPRVARVGISADGTAGAVETVVELPGTVPDGVAFDTDGNLYVSMYRPDIIYRRTPRGQLDVLAEDFEGTLIAAPTNIAFCGPQRDILLGANIGRWHITRYQVAATGLSLHYPTIS
jgi:gluconolactonase